MCTTADARPPERTLGSSIIALDLVGSASVWASILTAQALPRIALIVVGGVAADRLNARFVLGIGNVLEALALVTIAALHRVGVLSVLHLYAFVVVYGCLAAFTSPSADSLMPSLLPRQLVRGERASVARAECWPVRRASAGSRGAGGVWRSGGARRSRRAVCNGRTVIREGASSWTPDASFRLAVGAGAGRAEGGDVGAASRRADRHARHRQSWIFGCCLCRSASSSPARVRRRVREELECCLVRLGRAHSWGRSQC